MRRVVVLIVAVAVATLGVGLTGGTAGAQKAKKIASCKKDKKLNENIQAAFVPFFLGETSAARASSVQDGEKIIPMLDKSTAAAQAGGQSTSSTVTYPVSIEATCDGKKAATFTYDLATGIPKPVTNPPSTGIGLDFAGDAALVKGKWVITAGTICDLIGANPATPTLGAECLDAIS
jgi:hypothetical protein